MDRFHTQFREVANLLNGQPIDIVKDILGNSITNEDTDYIDANWLDILVTFNLKDGKAFIWHQFECYDEHGTYIGTESGSIE